MTEDELDADGNKVFLAIVKMIYNPGEAIEQSQEKHDSSRASEPALLLIKCETWRNIFSFIY